MGHFQEMALYDPEQAGPAAPYLRLSQTELLTLQNRDFGGRKAVWVPHKDDEKSYVQGTIVGDGKKPNTKSVEFEGSAKDFKVIEKYIFIISH